MKKLLSIVLAMAMVLALGVTAFAAETWNGSTEENANTFTGSVTATYTAGSEVSWGDAIYSVTISWEPVGSIVYKAGTGAVYKWNADQTIYEEETAAVAGDWTVTAGTEEDKQFTGMIVTVTNRSNADVAAQVTAANASGLTVIGSWDKQNATVESAAPANPSADNLDGSEKTSTFTYTITDVDGAPAAPAEGQNTVTVSTITITLTK